MDIIDALPLTATGKIRKAELKKQHGVKLSG